ncbi:putative tam domain methyltransferase protein [Botrytis fragariae]|uniref:Putative tam domain methyltransferase protein n=1 Tax=Botrytis fragariae TaxID=1964551 RepID=A0A8H6ATB8_9HELO|nr:putative tam domain methyltransferase protein [Botrytis fragariae]KAF5873055.1 putative tam domain methyltransferase protein [Botrytis fragariae]
MSKCQEPAQCALPPTATQPQHAEDVEAPLGFGYPGANMNADPSRERDTQSSETPESDDGSSSKSLTSSVVDFPEENGRTYHGYRPGTYHFPNDVNEQDRLEAQFDMLKCAFSGRNFFAPLSDPRCILDIGTGTGQWAIQMGDTFPEAEVQATDLSPIQPVSVPENVHFYIDDASDDDWVLPSNHFDYIHTRVLLGCFKDFETIIKRGFHYTKPGGYMESQEILFTPYCDDESMTETWPFLEWIEFVEKAAIKAGRPMNIAKNLKSWYEAAGFVDVQEKVFKLPVNPWSKDKHLHNLGEMSEENWLACLSSFSMALFSRILNWKQEQIEVYLVNVRKSIPNRNVHAYNKIYVVWGRKPEESEKRPSSTSEEMPSKVGVAQGEPAKSVA